MKKYAEKRPWGGFERFTLNEKSSVKILSIKPGAKLSLQKHKHRSEFWKILDNSVRVSVGNRSWLAKKGEEIMVPKGALHRIEGYLRLARILEISFGKFDENDVVRIKDIYGRV
ncbi:MAG: phosphomannose isomerase type II C-terminal cupin domain [Nanoarchaeota archaeon]